MSNTLKMIIGALVVFIVGLQLISDLVTGTDTGSTLITSIAPLLLAVVVIIVLVKAAD